MFKQTAPVIKLPDGATEGDHFALLGLLNSSTAGFWLKQISTCKGLGGQGGGIKPEHWHRAYAFNATKLQEFPIPAEQPVSLTSAIDLLSQTLTGHAPAAALATPAQHTRALLDAAKQRWTETIQRMIALQEELDWECYQLYGLTEAKLVLPPDQVPRVQLGERVFEIVMARKLAAGELETKWFEIHGSTPITELPAHWPQPYRELVQRRIALIESDRNIALIEQPEYKHRWNVEPWDEQLERALREWLLNRLEQHFVGGERMRDDKVTKGQGDKVTEITPSPALVSTNQLAAVVETDTAFLTVAEIYSGGPGFSVSKLVRELVEGLCCINHLELTRVRTSVDCVSPGV